MSFEQLPQTPSAEELLDQAYSRAARAGRAKQGSEAQQSMLQTASTVCADNLENVVTEWPDFDALDPYHRDLAAATVDVDALRQHLNEVGWAARKVRELRDEYQRKLSGDAETARKFRKQAFARIADVIESVDDDLTGIREAHQELRRLPELNPDEPAIVVAGTPNVGKSSFVNRVTNASNETASYPFTTGQVQVGHVERNHVRYQLVDTPGLLDRPAEERNDSERHATSALEHLADAVLFFIDASGTSGYPLETQLSLRSAIAEEFAEVPLITVCNKADLSRDAEADVYLSVTEGENLDTVLDMAVDTIGYEPPLPHE
jgi:nucleolar GTP-binding protein